MLLNTLEKQAALQPNAIALQGDSRSWSWQQYHDAVKAVAEQLSALKVKRLALEMDNSPEWAIIDLACLISGVVIIPVPPFQRATENLGTIISLSGCTNRWGNHGGLAGTRFCARKTANPCSRGPRDSAGRNGKDNVYLRYNRRAKRRLSESGWYGMDGSNVSDRIALLKLEKRTVTLPLSILLENLCGVYIPLLLGAETVILPPSRIGFEGSSRFNPAQFLQALATGAHKVWCWYQSCYVCYCICTSRYRAVRNLYGLSPQAVARFRLHC